MDDANNRIYSALCPDDSEPRKGICILPLMILRCRPQTLKRRLPPTNAPGGLLNLHAFKSAAFTIYCLSAFVIFLGLYTGQPDSVSSNQVLTAAPTVLTYANVSASMLPNNGTLSFYLVAIANASSIFGRYAAGSISDRVGWCPV
jgi:MFS transporter, MCT family, solute carrier family 16 (monocarboxylic acid transporters), member 10